MKAPIFVLYHKNCADGFGAAWAAWMALGDEGVTYLPVQYGDPVPEMPDGAEVFIVDFSFPREVLLGLDGRMSKVVVLDHHKSAQEALAGLELKSGLVMFDMGKSGAVLAWEHFHPFTEVPEMLLYVQDRDLWRWEMVQSQEINAGLWRGTERDFVRWRQLWGGWDEADAAGVTNWGCLRSAGEALLMSDSLWIESLVKRPQWLKVLGWTVPAVNCPVLQSELGHALLERFPQAPFAVVWSEGEDGQRVFSLRSRAGDFDVSVVAKEFGGGGHAAAAGFKGYSGFQMMRGEPMAGVAEQGTSDPAQRVPTSAGGEG